MNASLTSTIKKLIGIMIKEGIESISIRRGWRSAGSNPEDYSVNVNYFRPAKCDIGKDFVEVDDE